MAINSPAQMQSPMTIMDSPVSLFVINTELIKKEREDKFDMKSMIIS